MISAKQQPLRLQQRCTAFLDKFAHRIDELATQLETKADKTTVDQLSVTTGTLVGKINTAVTDISYLNNNKLTWSGTNLSKKQNVI